MHSLLRSAWEVLTRYWGALREADKWPVVAVLLAMALLLPSVTKRLRKLPPQATACVLLIAICAVGVAWAWHLGWVCDDAYISFRYSKNLASGHGLVFNSGERVEGYTNFLWTVIMAVAVRMHLDPAKASIVLSVGCFVATLVMSDRIARRLAPERAPVVVSLATLLLAANYIFASFATSGLETMFGAMLMLLALERAMSDSPLAAGIAGIAATMTHPDHALLYAALGAALLTFPSRRRGLVRYAIPFVAIYVPYFLLRWRYYGDPFPNTYYVKSADRTYFTQGLSYIVVCGLGGGFWAAVPLAVYGCFQHRRELIVRYLAIGLVVYLTYLAKVGGDFMYGRLLCPIVPPLLLVAELGARTLIARGRTAIALPAVALLAVIALPVRMIHPGEKKWELADERTFYSLRTFSPLQIDSVYFEWGHSLRRRFTDQGLHPTIATPCVGMIGYFSELPLLDILGLNDRTVAHQPIIERGRPGHEKAAWADYILSRRDVDITDGDIYAGTYARLASIQIDGRHYQIAHYRPELFTRLRGRAGVQFVDIQEYIDQYVTQPDLIREQGESDLAFFKEFYFSVANDPARLAKLEAFVKELKPFGKLNRELLFDFENRQLEGWTVSGNAFEFGTTPTMNPGEQLILGSLGLRLVNSFHRYLHDEATGTAVSPLFRIDRSHIGLRVGGGEDASTRVELRVDGAAVAHASGRNTEQLFQAVWDVDRFRGKQGQIVIVDASTGAWGHILVDDIEMYDLDPRLTEPAPPKPKPKQKQKR